MSRKHVLLTVATMTVAMSVASSEAAITATLRNGLNGYTNGVNGVQDTNIYYYVPSANAPGVMRASNGGFSLASNILSGSGSARTLQRWNLSSLSNLAGTSPTATHNAVVTTDAKLRISIYQSQTIPNPLPVGWIPGGDTLTNLYVYQIAPENAGWVAGTKSQGTTSGNSGAANTGDATWHYKAIDASLPSTTVPTSDSTSTRWHSAQFFTTTPGSPTIGAVGVNPNAYAESGGLWNQYDIVDANPTTPVNSFADMDGPNGENMDPLDFRTTHDAVINSSSTAQVKIVNLTIPKALIQSWIDNPSSNAGLLIMSHLTNSFNRIYTAESTSTFISPQLSFSYVVPEPTSIAAIGAAGLLLRRRR